MPRFRVELTKSASREFARLPATVRQRFADAIDLLSEGATRARPGVDIKRLHGTKRTRRLRAGEYRCIYEVEGDVVVFTRFAHRSKVYDA